MPRLLVSQSIRQDKWSSTNQGEPVKLLILGEGGVGKSALVVKYLTRRFIHDYSKCNFTYRHCTLVDDEPTLIDIVDWTSASSGSSHHNHAHSNDVDPALTSPRTSYSSRSSSGTPPMPSSNDYVNVPLTTPTAGGVSNAHTCSMGGANTHANSASAVSERIAGVDLAHVKSADGYMIVYSTTDRRSFERAVNIKRALDDTKKARHVSCVLVAAKMDQRDSTVSRLSSRNSSSDSNYDSDDCMTSMVSAEEGESVAGDMACAFFETSSYASEGWKGIADAFDELCREIRRRKRLEAKPARRKSSAQQIKNLFINKMFKTSHSSQNV